MTAGSESSTALAAVAEGGRAVVQAITVDDAYFPTYRANSDYIRQYTFPGGMLLSEQAIRDQARASGLRVNDVFGFQLDFSGTHGGSIKTIL